MSQAKAALSVPSHPQQQSSWTVHGSGMRGSGMQCTQLMTLGSYVSTYSKTYFPHKNLFTHLHITPTAPRLAQQLRLVD
eukprot:358331-Chlamydomonas_euryale.AAC.3